MEFRVPFVNPRAHYEKYKKEINAAITSCLAAGDLIDRRQLLDFERQFAEYVGVGYAVGVNSGYHALEFSLRAAGIGRGDEVITVAHTFVATVSAIVNVGATPVLVDMADDFNMDPDACESAITARTSALLPVSLNGRCCRMDRLLQIAEKRHLILIEDSAQALGASFFGKRAGSFGLAGCFSFYPFKLLGGFGDGGAITTNDARVAEMVQRLRYNGEDRETGEYHCHGATALLDNVQAAVLGAKLKYVPEWIEHRRRIAALYCEGLQDCPRLKLPHFDESQQSDTFQNYVIRAERRDDLRAYLASRGIETLVHWRKPLWEHKALALRDYSLERTKKICKEILSLPMSAETTPEEAAIVIAAIREFYMPARPRIHPAPAKTTVALPLR